MKKLLTFILLLTTFTCFSRVIIPMPIPVHHNSSGNSDPNVIVAFFIALNLICILTYLIKTIIWLIKKDKDCSFKECVIWSDCTNVWTDLNTGLFISINFFALIIMITAFIFNLL